MQLLALRPEECTGCRTCELICALHNFQENNPAKAALRVRGLFPAPGHYDLRLCDQCGECARVCPTEAIYRTDDGAYLIDASLCTGCYACVEACPKGVMFTHDSMEAPIKCNACGECVTYCPKRLLAMGADGETGRRGDGGNPEPRTQNPESSPLSTLPGYAGRILRVNLTSGAVATEPLKPEMVRDYLGGRGFAARLLYDEIPAGADPLGPENRVAIASGPLSGTFVPAAGKITFAAKSPATGGWGDSNMGGHLASELKYAGYDAIVLEGAAAGPSYLYVENDTVEIRDAAFLWGKGAIEAERALKDELGEEFQIATIGQAGENMVAFACVGHDFGRQAGRTGVGAVLGSKKLKAVAVRGTRSIPVARPEEAMAVGKEMFRSSFDAPNLAEWQRYGTGQVPPWANSIGAFPTRNFQSGYLEGHESLSHEVMRRDIVINDKACFSCPMACGKYSRSRTEGYDVYVEGPEYETTALIGGNCAIPDMRDVAYANYLCDEYGLDTISTGAVIGFAMECFEKGIITERDTEGIQARFGSVDAFAALARKIAFREGIGNILADGVRKASQQFGGGSERFAIQVKGLEWSGYESRGAPANMLAYITADIGSHHNRAWAITTDISLGRDVIEGKARKVIDLQHIRPAFDVLGVCRLLWVEIDFDLAWYPRVLQAVTGMDYGWDELNRVSERVWNLTRLFWMKHQPGFGRKDDLPPARFCEEPVPDGPTQGRLITRTQIDRLLDEYYALRGWDADGHPIQQKLAELGL
ncbi:MAG: aldehyde ferredoxin oxidoreductase C-terminal domain-containing protein [Chloroflexota bacterium]